MADNTEHQLAILCDPTGHKIGCKLFEQYVQGGKTGNVRRLPEFLLALDRLMQEFGAQPLEENEEDDSNPDEDIDDEDDIANQVEASEESDMLRLKKEVAKLLVTGRIKGEDEYQWYKWNSKDHFSLSGKRGQKGSIDDVLATGTIFGVRPSSNPRNPWRVVLKDAISKVYSLPVDEIHKLISKSRKVG